MKVSTSSLSCWVVAETADLHRRNRDSGSGFCWVPSHLQFVFLFGLRCRWAFVPKERTLFDLKGSAVQSCSFPPTPTRNPCPLNAATKLTCRETHVAWHAWLFCRDSTEWSNPQAAFKFAVLLLMALVHSGKGPLCPELKPCWNMQRNLFLSFLAKLNGKLDTRAVVGHGTYSRQSKHYSFSSTQFHGGSSLYIVKFVVESPEPGVQRRLLLARRRVRSAPPDRQEFTSTRGETWKKLLWTFLMS